MWYRMSRSRHGVMVGVAALACLLLLVSTALAHQQDEDRDRHDNGQQTRTGPAQNEPAQPPAGTAGPQQERGSPPGPAQTRGMPGEPPRFQPAVGTPARVGWGARDNATSPAANPRPAWGPPTAVPWQARGRPDSNQSSSGQTSPGYYPGRWTYRPSTEDNAPRTTTYRPAVGEAQAARDRQANRSVQQPSPVANWQPRLQPARDKTTWQREQDTARQPDSQRVPASGRAERNREPERAQPQANMQNRPEAGNRKLPNESAVSRMKERRARIPEANFRGPQVEQNLTSLPKGEGERVKQELRDRLRHMNFGQRRPDPKPAKDVVGNIVPADAQFVFRSRLNYVSVSYQNITVTLGEPTYQYVFLPRTHAAYWHGYWDGYADGYWAAQYAYHHPVVVLAFYYPYYYSDPYWVAFWYADLYPSIYHYWGWCPGWVFPQRVYYAPVEYVYVPTTPYRYYYTGYHLDEAGARQAIEDIRRAWLRSDIDLLAYHLTDQQDIQVYFDGKYEYTTSTEDYYGMTADAMATTRTVALDFDPAIWISSHEVFYTGRHVFYDPDGIRNCVYVSYRLRRLGGEWYIVAVGSSLEPIQHKYRDFRYS